MSRRSRNDDGPTDPNEELKFFHLYLGMGGPRVVQKLIIDPTFLPNALIGKLREQEGNYILSPIMIEILMMALLLGSKGETAHEIRNSLRQTHLSVKEVRRTAKALVHTLMEEERYKFFPVQKLFVRSMLMFKQNFKIVGEGVFYLDMKMLNFTRPNKATSAINKYVSRQTDNQLRNTIPYDLLTDASKGVIVSSVYYRIGWNTSFNAQSTSEYDFIIKPGHVVKTKFMHTLSYYNYYESPELKAKLLELKLSGEYGSMVFILPDEPFTVSYLEDNIATILTMPESVFTEQEIRAELPKFILSKSWDIKPVLQELGISRLFVPRRAQLQEIAGHESGDLYINNIFHHIAIRFDEDGIISSMGNPGQDQSTVEPVGDPVPYEISVTAKEFIANRPFMFYVKFRGVIISIGKFVEPGPLE